MVLTFRGRCLRFPTLRARQNIRVEEITPKDSFTGRTDTEAEALILWPTDGKSQLIGKDPDAGKG